MKTKIVKDKGYYKLIIDDEKINQQYDCSNKDPIVLGHIINFFDSGCWSVCDYRLTKHRSPSPYLEEGVEQYWYTTEEEKLFVLSNLNTYRINQDTKLITWHRFDIYAFDGDNLNHTDSRGKIQNEVARFTFKGALQRLKEQKEFWSHFDGDDLSNDKTSINNPARQINSTALYFMRRKKELEDKIVKNNKFK